MVDDYNQPLTPLPEPDVLPDRVPLQETPAEEIPPAIDNEAVQKDKLWQDDLSYLDSIKYHLMSDFFDIKLEDRRDSHLAEKLSLLTDWVQLETGSKNTTTHFLKLKEITKSLGLPMKGKDLIEQLYKWVRLAIDRKRIENKMKVISISQKEA